MILQTMTDDEKAFEAFRIVDWAWEIYMENGREVLERFQRGTKFPYFNRIVFDDDKGNKWRLVYECSSKKLAKKGLMRTFCYTIYNVLGKKGNAGKGIIMFDVCQMHEFLREKKYERMATFMDIVPHAFNRFTERFLKPQGKENIEFERKVEILMSNWLYFDVEGDKSSEKHKDKGDFPYDVFMKNGGILRGNVVTNMLIRFFTFVSKDMLFDEQKEWHKEMQSEVWSARRRGIII